MLLIATTGATDVWAKIFKEEAKDMAVHVWPDCPDPAAVEWVAAWKPPSGVFEKLPNLKGIFSLGAGVDALLSRDDLPNVPLVRIVDGGMAAQMAEYALYGILHVHRSFDVLRRQQIRAEWRDPGIADPEALRVGILGLGALGGGVIERLRPFGFSLKGWSRSAKQVDGVDCFHGLDQLPNFLGQVDVLVILIPLTDETRGLISRERLALLPKGASIINLARGPIIDEGALIRRLDTGDIRFALLDVFEVEPLSPKSPLWHHERVIVTPHSSAATLPRPAVRQILGGIADLKNGKTPAGLVNRSRGY
ncbi:2-hydroxyacid dehydrogenase [Lacibacterium aquatile]|uniref:2-hydroxyacid dehydrogenase n=1 Tax=Lacibacterium aquatile TaxID=1168082 RepID=A0ABW5DWZ9_9PROT